LFSFYHKKIRSIEQKTIFYGPILFILVYRCELYELASTGFHFREAPTLEPRSVRLLSNRRGVLSGHPSREKTDKRAGTVAAFKGRHGTNLEWIPLETTPEFAPAA
jgi:hypothetical protein